MKLNLVDLRWCCWRLWIWLRVGMVIATLESAVLGTALDDTSALHDRQKQTKDTNDGQVA